MKIIKENNKKLSLLLTILIAKTKIILQVCIFPSLQSGLSPLVWTVPNRYINIRIELFINSIDHVY